MRASSLSFLAIGGAWTLLVGGFLRLHETIFVLLFDRGTPAYGEFQFAFIWSGIFVLPGVLMFVAGLALLLADRRRASSR